MDSSHSQCYQGTDRSRPVISGMHSLTLTAIGPWRIRESVPIWSLPTPTLSGGSIPAMDKMLSVRTLLHATAETVYFGTVSGKPCLVEELGTMGPMICNEETAARFMRVNLFSNWANGAMGVLWWCANEQSHLTAPPMTGICVNGSWVCLTIRVIPNPCFLK
jgi:hypothetical protein